MAGSDNRLKVLQKSPYFKQLLFSADMWRKILTKEQSFLKKIIRALQRSTTLLDSEKMMNKITRNCEFVIIQELK